MRDTNDQRVAGGDRHSAARLEDLVGDLDGVAGVEVDIRDDGSPQIRVWLDGSATSEEVGHEIQRILAAADAVAEVRPTEPARRVGLGRSLGELLEANGEPAPLPLPPVPVPPPPTMRRLLLVAVEETAAGVSVRAADSQRGVAFSPVSDPNSLNEAVVAAVAGLHENLNLSLLHLAAVEVRDVAGESVLTVLLRLGDGRTFVGSEVVRGGLPFTLGQAVWRALTFVA